MTRNALMISVALASLAVAAPAMAAGSLYTLPMVKNSTETIAFGINSSQTVTGFWLDSSGVEHGFVGPASGAKYKSFDAPTDPNTQARGISPNGTITGIDNSTGTPTTYIPFERTPHGVITTVTMGGTALNYLVQGINKKNIFTGSYDNSSSQVIAYIGKNAAYTKTIKLKGIKTTGVAGRGTDDNGDIVGWYLDTNGVQHGFLQPHGAVKAVTIDDPNGTTNPEGINNNGEISGLYTDSSSNRHGFIYDIATKKFTELTVPNSTFVEVWGLNDDGVVAIDGENSSAVFVGYLYCPSARVCPKSAVAVKAPQAPVLHHEPHPLIAP
jgi:hypothetical protein